MTIVESKPPLRGRALEMRRQIALGRLVELDAGGRRLRAAQREQIKKRIWVFVLLIGRFNIAAC